MKPTKKEIICYGAVVIWAIGCFAFLNFFYHYHFFYQEQNQLFLLTKDYVSSYLSDGPGWLARLTGDFLTQFYYYLFLGPAILTVSLLCIGDFTRRLLQNLGVPTLAAFGTAIILMTVFFLFSLHHDYRLSNVISAAGILLFLWLATCLSPNKKGKTLLFMLLALIPAYWLFQYPAIGKSMKPNFYLERQFAVDNEYRFGNYDKVISLVENDKEPTPEMKFFYNLVRAQRGELPDYLMRFTPNDLGTFYHIGPETPRLTINNMNELYWAIGDMTFTERAALMTHVFAPDNRNVRMIRRLAECNLVSGDSAAAEKYLQLLDNTFVYRKWAANVREHAKEIYQDKMRFVNRRDTITTVDNAHFIMMQLLDHAPDNYVALDYILCSTLLLKDVENFKRDYDRYCMATNNPRIKTLYQEALCIWLAAHKATEDEWMQYIKSEDVLRRFAEYNEHRGSAAYKGTYWYYFDTFNRKMR